MHIMLHNNQYIFLLFIICRGLFYKGSVDCLVQTVNKEGFMALYKGFVPIWSRMVSLRAVVYDLSTLLTLNTMLHLYICMVT